MFESDYKFFNLRTSAVLTNSYVATTILGDTTVSERGPIQLKNQLILYVDFTIGSLTTAEIKVEYSNDKTNWYQETYDDVASSTGIITERNAVRQVSLTGKYRIPIKINDRYIRISIKGTGTVTNSLATIDAIIGNN